MLEVDLNSKRTPLFVLIFGDSKSLFKEKLDQLSKNKMVKS